MSRLALLALIVGVPLGGIHLLFIALLGRPFPEWPLVGYLGAAFGLGIVVLVGEVVFYPITHFLVDSDDVTDPLWLRLLRASALVLVGSLLVLVVAWFNVR